MSTTTIHDDDRQQAVARHEAGELKTDVATDDLLLPAAKTAWLEYAKGTYSNTDKRIFVEGFRRGWQGRRQHALKQLPQSYTSITISCWLCRGEHLAGVKWCPVLVKAGL